jgi:hypothetical protein
MRRLPSEPEHAGLMAGLKSKVMSRAAKIVYDMKQYRIFYCSK